MAQPPQSRPYVHGHEEAVEQPMQQLSSIAYCPKSTGVKVIQQYVSTIAEEARPGETCAREGDIWDYDLIGAVGLKGSTKKNRATVVYHVKWKGFPISDMTWEPESHFHRGDLEVIWSTHGRVIAGKVVKFDGEDDGLQRDSPDRSSVSPQRTAPNTMQLSDAGSKPVEPRLTLLPDTVSTTALRRLSDIPWL